MQQSTQEAQANRSVLPLQTQRSGRSLSAALCSALCTVQACHRKEGQEGALHILPALSPGADINGALTPHRPLCHLQKRSFLFPATFVWLHRRRFARLDCWKQPSIMLQLGTLISVCRPSECFIANSHGASAQRTWVQSTVFSILKVIFHHNISWDIEDLP